MDSKDLHVLIKYGILKGTNTVEAKTWLDNEFPGSAPLKPHINYCYAKFRRGEVAEHGGRPKEVVSDENIKKIHQILKNNRKVKVSAIADTLKISSEPLHHVIHEYFDM